MNYIKKLQTENEQLKNIIAENQILINDLLSTLCLPKFYHPNNFINTNDLFKPLQDIRMNLTINS